MLARAWHSAVAGLVVLALAIQLVIALRAPGSPSGHLVGTLAGASTAGRILRALSFFTIQSNVLAAAVCARLARDGAYDSRAWRVARMDALVGITVTGIVYATVLARIHEPKGWEQVSTNAVFHYVVPVMTVLGWLIFGPRPRIDRRTVVWSLGWPVAWLSYTLVHGAISHWYPYPFVDVTTQGYGRVIVNALLVTVAFGLAAAGFAFGDRRLGAAPT